MAGVVCSKRSKVHSMLSEGVVGGLIFTIDLCGPLISAPFPLLMLRALRSKQSI